MGTIKLKLPTSESKLKVSSASSNITINTNSSYTSRLTFLNFIKIISLNSLVYTISITILQLYLITNRLRLLADLSSYMSNSPISSLASSILATNVDPKLNNSIVINAFLITFSLLFTLLHLVIGSVRIGIYSHDGFKLGTSLDRSHTSLDIDINKNELNSSLTTGTSDEGSKSSSKKGLTKNESKPFGLSSFECCRFRTPKFWPQLPPLGACFHLISAIFLLIAEVQLNSKRIQLGHKPIGDIFSTKLDFMLGEPIIRLQQSYSMRTAQEKETNQASTAITPNSLNVPSGIQDIIHSKDDFSVFNSGNVIANDQGSMPTWQSSSNLMTSNTIGLDYLNLVIALVVFAVKIAQTFWNSSRQFSTLVLFYCLNVSSLMAVSYCSYEILFKANNLQKIAKQLLYLRASKIFTNEQGKSNGNSGAKKFDSQAKMNLIEDYGHDLISTILFLLSSFILFLNCYLITRFGYKKFNELKSKFELGMNKHLLINNHLKSAIHLSNQSESSKCGEKAGKQNVNSVNECSSLASSPKQEKASLDRSMSSDSSSSDDLSKSSMSSSDESSSSSKKSKLKSNIRSSFSFLNKGKNENKPRSCSKLNCSSSYCEHLLSTGLLLVYCLLRSLFIFEIFIVFKYSNDVLFIITILLELLTILVWILSVILLTIKNEWSFRLSSDYKLVYWDWMHKQNSISSFSKPVVGNVYTESKEAFKTSQHNDFNKSNSLIINEYGIEDKKEKIEFEPNIVELKRNSTISLAPRVNNLTTSDVFEKSAGLEKSSSSNFLSNNYSCSQFTTTTTNNMNQNSSNTNFNNKNNGLLVRDDSILLNRSNNMSTSSITEVSSLMPSVCGNLAMSNKQLNQSFNSSFNSNPNKKPANANILNASSLSASLNPKMINQQFKERQSIADYSMFFNNSMSDKNPYIVNANNQHVDTIDDKNETILSDEFDENYKRLRLNNRSNRSSKIVDAGDFNIEQMSKQAFFYDTNINYQTNKKIDNDRYEAADSEQHSVKLRAHSSRPLPMNKQVSFGNSSLRISNPNMMQIKTVGEIMEQDAANVQHHAYIQNQSKIVQNSSIKAKIIHKQSISINDSSSSSLSSATADSGMDSIVDSPTNNQSIKQQQSSHGLMLNQNQGLLTAKPFLLGVNSPSSITIETNVDNKNNFGSNQVTVIQAAHFLDTRC